MHAWLCTTLDGADALSWQELPTPEPGPGQARVAVDVHLGDGDVILRRQGLQDWLQHLAGATPGGPKIKNDEFILIYLYIYSLAFSCGPV